MGKKQIEVKGFVINIDTVNENDFISLTDIAKQSSSEPNQVIRNWLQNSNTVRFLHTWEKIFNPDFVPIELESFLGQMTDNRYSLSVKRWTEKVNAVGILAKQGRAGCTYAHKDIALEFCTWLSPEFKVYFIKEWMRLKEDESKRKNLEWHISKITDNIEEVRNLLDTIPGQLPDRNRIKDITD